MQALLAPGHSSCPVQLTCRAPEWYASASRLPACPSSPWQHFTPDEWDRHLTFRRYFPEPRILLIIIISMSPLWGWSVLCAAAVGLWAELAEPRGWPAVSTHPSFLAPFTLTSFALSLLMLFKTNSRQGRACVGKAVVSIADWLKHSSSA